MRIFKIIILIIGLSLILATLGYGQEVYFGKNKVQYKHFSWSYIQTPNFDIYFYEDQIELARFAAKELEVAYKIIAEQLHYWPHNRLPVFVYNAPNEFQQTNIYPDILEEGIGGFTESFKNREVVPFDGSYDDFRHVLHHELTHAFTYDLLYGGAIGSMFSRRYLFQLPDWFAEGFAEYSSRFGWDYYADMIMRDATINDYIQPIENSGGYLAYKQGQLILKFIAEKYGEEKISELLYKGKSLLSMTKAMKRTIGLSGKEFDEEFAKYCRRIYWPEISKRQEAQEVGKRLTDHKKDGSYFNEKPVFAPTGDKLAIFTDKEGYTEIILISTLDGKVLGKLVKSNRSGDLESLHSFVSGMSFSPDGNRLAFVSKSHGEDALRIYDIKHKRIAKKFTWGFASIANPSWGGSDSSQIVFSGLKNGQEDLYRLDLKSGKLIQLTNDFYDDKDAAYSPDGQSIAFASDRPVNDKDASQDVTNLNYGNSNIFRYELASGEIAPITQGQDNKHSPTWSPDGKKLAFVANYNGIDNLYVKDLESGDLFPVTNILTEVSSPNWSPKGDRIAFSSFNNMGYDIFMLTKIKPAGNSPDALEKTAFFKGEMGAPLELATNIPAAPIDSLGSDTTGAAPESPPEEEPGDYVFRTPDNESSPRPMDSASVAFNADSARAARDSLYGLAADSSYTVKKYKTKFTPDYVTGGVSYDTFFGLRGQSAIVFSDYLGNHQFYLITDLVNTIDQTNFQLFYFNNVSRIDWGAGIYHTKYYYVDAIDRLFSDRYYGASFTAVYPFSKYSRTQLDFTHLYIDRKYYDKPYDDSHNKISTANLSLVGDNILWGQTGPATGNRWKLSYEKTLDFYHHSVSYWASSVDYRKYNYLGKRFSTAFRIAAGMSGGANPKRYFLGGATNWIKNMDVSEDIYQVNNLYFSEVITPLRGYDYYEIGGRKFALMNLEFRFPFVDYLVAKFPLPIFLSRITGALFLDMGAAWDEDSKFKGGVGTGPHHLQGIKSGFGYGARINLGFLLLKFDTAWRTDFDHTSKPRYYFSLGAEY